MGLIDHFGPPKKRPGQPDVVKLRRVPIQPPDTPFDKLWMGSELGYLSYSGPRPRVSDCVTVVGQVPNQVVLSVGDPVQRDPIFVEEGCKCKCPQGGGVAFSMAAVQRASPILALDRDGLLRQVFGAIDTYYPRGVAVDNKTPYSLYALDDRRTLSTTSNQYHTQFTRDYFWLVRFALVGDHYEYVSQTALTDPTPLSTSVTQPSLYRPYEEQDPPDFVHNGASVVEGTAFLTLYKPPARFLEFTGSGFATRTLTLNGIAYDKSPRGNIVTVPDKPANRTLRYICGVTATVSSGVTISAPELIQFNSDFEITARIDLTGILTYPVQLASVCNRLFVLDSNRPIPTPFQELLG